MREYNVRTVTFRCKSYTGNEWVYGQHYVQWDAEGNDRHYIVERVPEDDTYTAHHVWVNQRTLGECTGVVDKNGVTVYEGDIVRRDTEVYVVQYDPLYGRFACASGDGRLLFQSVGYIIDTGYAVVGNIFDNRELLKEPILF